MAASLIAAGLAPVSAVAADPANPPIPERYLQQQPAWDNCLFDEFFHEIEPEAPTTLCASITVPMDWRDPDAHPDISIGIAYSRATGVSKGLLTSNPGGPGASGLQLSGLLALSKPQLFRDYDLLGFDPRGFGDERNPVAYGTALHCYTTQSKVDALPAVVDPRVRNKHSHAADLAVAKLLGDACSSTELSQFVSTQQTVYDMEFLRQFLGGGVTGGYDKLNYIGYSYGTWLGAWYADTFPTHTGRFVLDSNMNWTSSMYANQVTDSFSFERRRDEMLYPWIARHDKTYHLGKTAAKVSRSYEKLRAQLVTVAKAGQPIVLPADADAAIATQLYADWQFPDAANTINDLQIIAGGGDSTARRRAVTRVDAVLRQVHAGDIRLRHVGTASAEEPVELEGAGGDAVRCNDSAYSRNLTKLLKRSDSDAQKFRFIGYTDTVNMCSYWRFPAQKRTIDLAGAPRMLMFQSEGDPATAYEGARAAHRAAAPHTRMVSVDNEGQHGLYIDGPSPCVEKIGDDFLFRGIMPSKDLVCGTTPLPSDSKVYKLKGPLDGKSYAVTSGVRSTGQPDPAAVQALREARLAAVLRP